MKRFLQLGLLALGLGWALPALAQNECGGLQVIQTTRDSLGRLHQVECFDPSTGQVTLPLVSSLTPSTIVGNPVVTGALTAQSLNDKLCVGAAPCYANTTLAATAAGTVNKTIIEIRSSYTGTDCGPAQDNIIYFDYRGMVNPCNANNSMLYNPSTAVVSHYLLESNLFVSSPAAGSSIAAYNISSNITGTLQGGTGLVDSFAAQAVSTGQLSGTLGTLRGLELNALVSGAGGTFNVVEGGAAGVQIPNPSATVTTTYGFRGFGVNGQTLASTPVNSYGLYAMDQQGKASGRNYSLGIENLGILRTNGSQAGLDAETVNGTAHTFLRLDASDNTLIQAISGNLFLNDNGGVGRAKVGGGLFVIPTACSIANPRVAESPVPLCALTLQKAEVGADASLLSYTPVAAAGKYRVCVSFEVSAQNTATLGWTATWTDSNGSAQTPTNLALTQTGVAAPALTFTAATNGNYEACQPVSINNGAVAIVVKTTFSGTSIAYKASATIERLI